MNRSTAVTEADQLRWRARPSGSIRYSESRDPRATLELVSRLCAALERAGIHYCHWKSNQTIDRSASGENDLDLLVDRGDVQRFVATLHGLGFKETFDPPRKRFPGVRHYYGADVASGRLVNVHAHYQLVLGDDATKNYRVPIEEAYLARATIECLFRIPEVEFEFILFVIRMVLKHATWDAILTLRGELSESEHQELAYLSSRVNQHRIQTILKEHLPYIGEALFGRCARSVAPRCSRWMRMTTARQLHRSLAACARRRQGIDTVLKLWRRCSQGIVRYMPGRRFRKRLATGGTIVAIVGGDGAGKSTIVDELCAWLSRDFLVRKAHLGKPRLSAMSVVVKGPMRVGCLLGLISKKGMGPILVADRVTDGVPGHAALIWHVLTARDRHRAYVRARRFALSGGIVVCDRYPHRMIKLMDGPRAAGMARSDRIDRVARYLAALEKAYYERILDPDVLIVLKIDPDVAVQRRAGEDAVAVRARCDEVWGLDWGESSAFVVDAGRPRSEVLPEVKSLVWSRL